MQKYIIVDTDMGPDDAWALLLLLKAEKCFKNITILAITCVDGNTTMENVIKNTYHILRSHDRMDISIHKGASKALIPHQKIEDVPFWGRNGMADIDFWPHDIYPANENEIVYKKNAVELIHDLVTQNPNQISLICLGPLTNISLAVKVYPEIADKVKEIFLMGGNIKGIGNATMCAEFNFYYDPEAAHIVLDSFQCPMTLLPLESCLNLKLSKEWKYSSFKDVNCKVVQLLNEALEITFKNRTYSICDAYLAAAFIFPEKCIRQSQDRYVTIELHGHHSRGQMIVDHSGKTAKISNVTIIEQLDEDEIKKALIWTANA